MGVMWSSVHICERDGHGPLHSPCLLPFSAAVFANPVTMDDAKREKGNHVLEISFTINLPNANKNKEETAAYSASLETTPPPTVGEFPDGGLAAWLVVVGVRVHSPFHTLR